MDIPEKMIYAPVYCSTEQAANSSKLGLLRAPLTAKLDLDDVFDGRRTCLLDYLSYAAEGGIAEVTHVAFLAKKGSRRLQTDGYASTAGNAK